MQSRTILSLALLLTLPGVAGAATISVSWTGTIDAVSREAGSVFAIGDPASGSFLIDTAVADVNPDSGSGDYPGAASALVFRFGGYEVSGSSGSVFIRDTLGDAFSVRLGNPGGPLEDAPPLEGFVVANLWFHVESGPGGLSGDAIPTSLDLGTFHGGGSIIAIGSTFVVGATASSLSYVVPEPGTATLLAFGVLLLASLRR
jgi:hypothetical protein